MKSGVVDSFKMILPILRMGRECVSTVSVEFHFGKVSRTWVDELAATGDRRYV